MRGRVCVAFLMIFFCILAPLFLSSSSSHHHLIGYHHLIVYNSLQWKPSKDGLHVLYTYAVSMLTFTTRMLRVRRVVSRPVCNVFGGARKAQVDGLLGTFSIINSYKMFTTPHTKHTSIQVVNVNIDTAGVSRTCKPSLLGFHCKLL